MSNPNDLSAYYFACRGLATANGATLYTRNAESGELYALAQRPYVSGEGWLPAGALAWTSGVESSPVATHLKKKLVAVANNQVWYESSPGTMTELIAAHGDIDTSTNLVMFEAYQKVFIINRGNYRVIDFGNVKLSTADIADGATRFIPNNGTLLIVEATGAMLLVDYIDSGTGACIIYGRRLTVATFSSGDLLVGDNDAGNPVSFTLGANEILPDPPHWYPYTTYANYTEEEDMIYGKLPNAATLGCLYRGRVVLSGDTDNPNQWYMARQANPWDWAYAALDAQSPIAGNDADAGKLGDLITTLVPAKDDYLVFGCADTISRLNGDAAAGGNIVEMSLTVGILDKYAYCFDDNDNMYFLSMNGLYSIGADSSNGVARPQSLTATRLPKFPRSWDVDMSIHRITLTYDRKHHGIIVCKTLLSDGSNENMWYDLRTGGLFPEEYPDAAGCYSAVFYAAIDPDYQDMLIGGTDGYIRKFDITKKDDDAGSSDTTITSYVVIGPQMLGKDPNMYVKFTSMVLVTSQDTDAVTYKIFTDRMAETLVDQLLATPLVPRVGGTFGETKYPTRLRQVIRGIFGGIHLSNETASQSWSMETIVGNLEVAGSL